MTDDYCCGCDAATAGRQAGTDLLLRHCQSLGTAEHRIPARVRLEEAIGPELARRLVTCLTARSRRPPDLAP